MMEKLSGEMARLKVAVTPKINEATAITNINEWSDNTFAKIREISRAKGVYDRDIIREICKDERFAGIDFTELKDEYCRRTRQKNPYLLKVIAATVDERKIFEEVLEKMHTEALGTKPEVEAIPEFTALSITEIIKPLIDKRGDKNPTATPTYRIVYKTMDVDWDKERQKYKLKHGLTTLPRKLTLVEEIPSMRDEFKKAVEKLLQ
jgi:predicted secreted Zn-dependent protease